MEIAEKTREINYLNKKLEQSENDRRKYSDGMKTLQKEMADKMKVIAQLNETNGQLKALYNSKEKEFFEFIKEYKIREEKYKQEKKAQTSLIISLQDQVNKQQTVISAIESLNKTLVAENNRIKDETSALKIHYNQALKSLADELECHKIDNERLRNSNLSLTITKSELEKEIEVLTKKVDQYAEFFKFVENLHIRNYFKGEIVNGKKNSECEEKGEDYYFKGQYTDGMKYGLCVLINEHIEQKGSFDNDLLQGYGTYRDLTNNKLLDGIFDRGEYTGNVAYIDQVKYKGNIRNNKLEGSGYFEFTNGYFFEGKFKNDRIDPSHKGIVMKSDIGEEYHSEYLNGIIIVEEIGTFEINYKTGALELQNNWI